MNTDTGKARGQGYFVWQRLKKNKGAMVGLIFLCFMLFLMASADFLFDYDEVVIKPDDLAGSHYYEFGDNKTEQAAKQYFDRIKNGGKTEG